LIDASICWAATKTDTQFTIFNSSALKKQLLNFRVARVEAFTEDRRTLYERDLCLWLEQGAALLCECRNLVLSGQSGSDVYSRALS